MNLLTLFDYIFYRTYRFFLDKGDNVPDTKGALVVSFVQFFTLLDLLVLVRVFYEFPLSDTILVIPLAILLVVVNRYRFENLEITKLEDQWKNEDKGKSIRNGWLIGLYVLISFLIPAVHGYLEHNLKVI